MARRRSRPRLRRWPIALATAHAVGLWLAGVTWAAAVRHLLPGLQAAVERWVASAWMPWLALLPALLGAVGFAWGWRWSAGPRPKPVALRMHALAFAGAWVVAAATGVLLPAFAALRAGAWPAAAWCMLGPAMAAVVLHRASMRPKPSLKEIR